MSYCAIAGLHGSIDLERGGNCDCEHCSQCCNCGETDDERRQRIEIEKAEMKYDVDKEGA